VDDTDPLLQNAYSGAKVMPALWQCRPGAHSELVRQPSETRPLLHTENRQ
jgi:hypothetical protein